MRLLTPSDAISRSASREIRFIADLVLKRLLDAERRRALLKNIEQPLALDAAEAMAAAADHLAVDVHVDVVPVIEAVDDGGMRFGIGVRKIGHGLVREHHAPAKGVVRPIAFMDFDAGARQMLLQKYCGVQPGRPAAHADDAFHELSCRRGSRAGRRRRRNQFMS